MKIIVGWDEREDLAYRVLRASLIRHATIDLTIVPLVVDWLRADGIYRRAHRLDAKGRRIDTIDGKPFSTDFAFTRFLVPALMEFNGVALFCDCDFLFRADVRDLFDAFDPRFAVQVVKHDHRPVETVKMDGQAQESYPRKNWSSLVLWNCGHPANRTLSPECVNSASGRALHTFSWLRDEHIGDLDPAWNWLEGSSDPAIDPKAIHYTRGGPWFADYTDVAYAEEWREIERQMPSQRSATRIAV